MGRVSSFAILLLTNAGWGSQNVAHGGKKQSPYLVDYFPPWLGGVRGERPYQLAACFFSVGRRRSTFPMVVVAFSA